MSQWGTPRRIYKYEARSCHYIELPIGKSRGGWSEASGGEARGGWSEASGGEAREGAKWNLL